ncbi:ABC transporter substrate-binding protein [Clostridium niameyense]|uniref:ABC transporter substrate-binding protein n=1 Tax=Clostridium niameyense TaxID=1622073 RepID=A0A6M0RE70_9CLOT|nr:ABC transporter substrate-binding protein [Clostridium niameyense]NEZ47698.1 ABC transporter substrate-binding protein [Clostridium niameyense]
MKAKKFHLLSLLLVLALSVSILAGCGANKEKEKSKDLVKVELNEVVRSVFYAPMYVAINEGMFKEEGLDIELSTGQGADKTISKTQV